MWFPRECLVGDGLFCEGLGGGPGSWERAPGRGLGEGSVWMGRNSLAGTGAPGPRGTRPVAPAEWLPGEASFLISAGFVPKPNHWVSERLTQGHPAESNPPEETGAGIPGWWEVRAGLALHHIRRVAWTRSRRPGGWGPGSAGAFLLKGGSCWEGARWLRGLVAGLARVGLTLPRPSWGPCRRSGCIAVTAPRDCSPSCRAPRRREKPSDLAQAWPVPRSPQPM